MKQQLRRERYKLLTIPSRWLEGLMMFLGFAWLVLLVCDGRPCGSRRQVASTHSRHLRDVAGAKDVGELRKEIALLTKRVNEMKEKLG